MEPANMGVEMTPYSVRCAPRFRAQLTPGV